MTPLLKFIKTHLFPQKKPLWERIKKGKISLSKLKQKARKGFNATDRPLIWKALIQHLSLLDGDKEIEDFSVDGLMDNSNLSPDNDTNATSLSPNECTKIPDLSPDPPSNDFANKHLSPSELTLYNTFRKYLSSQLSIKLATALIKNPYYYFPDKISSHILNDLILSYSPSLYKILKNKKYPQYLSLFFSSIYPKDFYFNLIDSYLVEGYKIIFRYSLAHILYLQSDLSYLSSNEINILLCTDVCNIFSKSINDIAYSLPLKRSHIEVINDKIKDKVQIYNIPKATINSSFLNYESLKIITEWIPYRFKFNDTKLIYSRNRDGNNIDSFYRACDRFHNIIIFIKIGNKKTIGGFISVSLSKRYENKGYFGTGECFIFELGKYKMKYNYNLNSNNRCFVYADSTVFGMGMNSLVMNGMGSLGADKTSTSQPSIGNRDGFGLSINSSLTRVDSNECETYHNRKLCKKNETIEDIEVFTFL
eukprot:GHVP01061087.1.p1 GENE.GHVP01061087.1~~GHVP01061087.1.p1  ORF type:complete len:478 (-),score=53.23 GHVP01061087.1:231-1664(-)